MISQKVKLITKDDEPYSPNGHCSKSVKYALPYYKSRRGDYFHRVRSATNYWREGDLSHTSVSFWCGNSGFVGKKGQLYPEVPADGVLCATCEGRAIGAGLDGARTINGKKVMYSPINKQ